MCGWALPAANSTPNQGEGAQISLQCPALHLGFFIVGDGGGSDVHEVSLTTSSTETFKNFIWSDFASPAVAVGVGSGRQVGPAGG